MALNPTQQLLFDTIVSLDWEQVLRVEGPGGTGKTYTVAKALETLVAEQPDIKICVSAVTHQALANIQAKLPVELRSKVEFRTVASLLGKALFSPEVGVKAATRGNVTRAQSFDLIVLDESSMVGARESQMLLDSKTRIIEMGDFAQLPPVMAKANVFGNHPGTKTIALTEQMRNGGAIYKIASLCRSEVHYPVATIGNVQVHETADHLLQEFIEKIQSLENPTEAIFLAFTRARVSEVAAMVHEALYGEAEFAAGQWLRMEQSIATQTKGHNVLVKEVGEAVDIYGITGHKVLVVNPHSKAEEWILTLSAKAAGMREMRMTRLLEEIKNTKDLALSAHLGAIYTELELAFVPTSSPFVLTIHKSQGQTIPYVYVDTQDVKSTKGGMKKNLLYVAYSRASVELNTVLVTDAGKTFRELRKKLGFGKVHKEVNQKLWKRGLTSKHKEYAAAYVAEWYAMA